MKVAYVVSLFPKISETFILSEMRRLRENGVEIVVVSLKSRREPLQHMEAEAFLPVTLAAPSPVAASGAFARRLAKQPTACLGLIRRVAGAHITRPVMMLKALLLLLTGAGVADRLRELRVDHVHAHWATFPAQVAWTVQALEGIPYSITAHAHDIFLPNPLLAGKILSSEFTATISEFNVALLRQLCGERASAKVRLVRCGVPLREMALRAGAPADPGRIISVGRLVDYKGFTTLVEAVSILRRRGRHVSCDIVGEGPMRAELARKIGRLGLDGSVRLLGARTQAEVRALMESAGICVLASRRGRDGQMDGIPVVLMEALALGVPVVSTRISGIPELVEEEKTGLLVEPDDAAALASAVERLLDDGELAARVASEGRRRVEALHDASANADALLDLIRGGVPGGGR